MSIGPEMLPDPASAIWLLLLGGWMAVDGTSVGQFMVSRPLVAATLGGWVMGDPVAGLAVGVLLELLHLAVLPVGAARFPESGPAAVVAGSMHAAAVSIPGALLMTVGFSLLWEWVGGASLRAVRQVNVAVVAGPDEEGRAHRLQLRHLAAISIDFARGMLVVGVGIICLTTLLTLSARHWMLDPAIARLATGAVAVGLFAATLGIFSGRRKHFLVGMAAGLVFLLLRG